MAALVEPFTTCLMHQIIIMVKRWKIILGGTLWVEYILLYTLGNILSNVEILMVKEPGANISKNSKLRLLD